MIVACEESGRVRDAFIAAGHDAVSCDIQPTSVPGPHIQGDIRDVDLSAFDLMIAHPPCTDLAVSGARHFAAKIADGRQDESLDLVRYLLDAPVQHIAMENPVSIISTRIRPPDQIIQPWQFGDPISKKTCLWLKNLPLLTPTEVVDPEYDYSRTGKKYDRWWLWTSSLPHPRREQERSKTFPGIAQAMADQWGQCESYITPYQQALFSHEG